MPGGKAGSRRGSLELAGWSPWLLATACARRILAVTPRVPRHPLDTGFNPKVPACTALFSRYYGVGGNLIVAMSTPAICAKARIPPGQATRGRACPQERAAGSVRPIVAISRSTRCQQRVWPARSVIEEHGDRDIDRSIDVSCEARCHERFCSSGRCVERLFGFGAEVPLSEPGSVNLFQFDNSVGALTRDLKASIQS
jgi:hypothetical protein